MLLDLEVTKENNFKDLALDILRNKIVCNCFFKMKILFERELFPFY